jgi:hypothetical protein
LKDGNAFEAAIQALAPGARGAELRALFDDRLSRHRICDYRKGSRKLPPWVAGMLSAKLERQAQAQLQVAAEIHKEIGPGRKAGARNLAEYLARRR